MVVGQLTYRLLWSKKGVCFVVAALLWASVVVGWFNSAENATNKAHA